MYLKDFWIAFCKCVDFGIFRIWLLNTKNPNLVLWSTAAGGHLSFVDGLFPVTSYLSKAVPECAALLCDFVQEEGDQLD